MFDSQTASVLPGRKTNPELAEAISDAQLLLAHASRAGMAIDPVLLQKIVDIGAVPTIEQIDTVQEADFWVQWNKLCSTVAPLTVDTLRANSVLLPATRFRGACTAARRAELRYRWYAIIALIMLLGLQAYWLFGNAVTTEIAKTDKAFDENLGKIFLVKAQLVTRKPGTVGGITVSSASEELEMSQLIGKDETLRLRQSASYEILKNWATPWSFFVPSATLPNFRFGTEALVKRSNASHFQASLALLDIIQRYFLSLLYGFLGACVYVLRNLSDEIKCRTYSSHSDTRFRIRLYLGALGGIVAAWFVTPENGVAIQSLSPFALAFVAGYGVELLFALMDKIISAFVGPAVTKSSDN